MDAPDREGNGGPETRRPRPRRRWLVGALVVVGLWLPLSAAALVASALHHLSLGPGRRAVCRIASTQVSALLVGELELRRCAALTPWHLRVEDAALRGPDGDHVARIGALDVRPSLWALLGGRLEVAAIRVEAPWASLRAGDDGLALVEAVTLAAPGDDTPDDTDGGMPAIVLRDVRIADGAVDDLPEGLAIRGVGTSGRVDLGDRIVVDVDRLAARALRRGEEVARLADTRGVLRIGAGETSELALAIDGAGDADVRVEAHLDWGDDGPAAVRGDVDATVGPELLRRLGQAEAARALSAPVRAEGRVEGSLDDLGFAVDLATPGGAARIDGRVGADRLEAEVSVPGLDVSAFLTDVAAEVRGSVEARVPLGGDGGAEGLEATVDLDVRGIRVPGLAARRLRVSGTAGGTLPTPRARLDVRVDALAAGGVVVERASLGVNGGPEGYTTRVIAALAPLPLGGREVAPALDGRLALRVDPGGGPAAPEGAPPRLRARGGLEIAGVWPGGVVAELRGVEVDDAAVRAERVSVGGRGLDVRASGRFAFAGASDLEAEIGVVDLETLAEALGLAPSLEGRVAASARFRGTPSRPVLTAHATAAAGRVDGVPLPDVTLDAGWDAPGRRASLRADARLREGDGRATLDAEVALGRHRDPVAALLAGRAEAEARVEAFDLGFLAALPGAPALEGRLDVTLDARGTLRRPTVDAGARLAAFRAPGLPAIDGAVDVGVDDGRVALEVRADEPGGPRLASLRVEVAERLAALARGEDPLAVLGEPWTVDVDVPPRRLDRLPPPVAMDAPVEVAVTGHLRGGEGSPASGDVVATARWVAGDDGGPIPGACGPGSIPSARAALSLADDVATLELTAQLDGDEVLRVSTEHPAPIERWARSGPPGRPTPLEVDARLHELALGRVPFACGRLSGTIDGGLRAVGLTSARPEVVLNLAARDLSADGGAPTRLTVEARADARRAEAGVVLAQEDGSRPFELTARAPLTVGEDGLSVALGDGPLSADVALREAPLALLLAPAPNVARPGGAASGHVTASGRSVEDLEVEGELTLHDASLTLTDPFTRLDGVVGRVALAPDRIVIEGLTTRERSGSLEVNGTIARDGFQPGRVDLRLDANQLIARREGIRIATIDGDVRVLGDLRGDPPRLDVRLEQLDVSLPDTVDASIQHLDPHPRVIYAGEPGFDRALGVEAALARHRGDVGRPAGAADAKPLEVSVVSRVPFWVRHPSFSIQLETDVTLRTGAGETTLRGPLTVRRGFIDILGKSFEFQRGAIRFTGAIPIDPALELTATHRVSSGHTVTVEIGGRLGDPELTFTSTDPTVTTDTDVIASILGVRSRADADQAENDTGSLLAGLVAGFVGSVTRRELGQYLPILSVESAGTAASTRVRAGFQADQIVPDAWRDVIQGVYVEGAVGGGDDQGDGASDRGVRAGFLIELFFPRQLRTSAEYEQPDNWSIDLTWEP